MGNRSRESMLISVSYTYVTADHQRVGGGVSQLLPFPYAELPQPLGQQTTFSLDSYD
jgi:hypothetical protein